MSTPARSPRESRVPDDLVLSPQDLGITAEDREQARQRFVARQRLVWAHRRLIAQAVIAGLLLSSVVAFLIPDRYRSATRLMPPDQPNAGIAALAAGSGLAAQFGSDLGSVAGDVLGLKSSSDLFLGILQSRTVQDDMIEKFGLQRVYSASRMEDARLDLEERTALSADRKSGIITIEVEDHTPARAAAMAGEYVSELDRVVTQLNTSSAHRERVFLEDRLAQVERNLETAEKSFGDFASKNTALDIPMQGRAMIEGAATLEGQLIAAETELQGLRQVYADGNVRVRATQARVDEFRSELKKVLGGTQNEPGTIDGQGSLYPSIRELPVLGVSYADLYRNAKIQEAVFQTLTQEYELAKVQEAKETPSVKVLDPPDLPDKKSFPPRPLVILSGTLLAVVSSVLWLLGKHRWDQTDENDPQKIFAGEVMVSVRGYLPWRVATDARSTAAEVGTARARKQFWFGRG